MKALVVDDDDLNRELLSRMLRRLGWTVDTARGGAEAVAASSSSYDVVFLDFYMRGMDGSQAAAAIRARFRSGAARGGAPFLAAVTGADSLTPDEMRPFDGLLRKPYTMADLSAFVASLGPGRA